MHAVVKICQRVSQQNENVFELSTDRKVSPAATAFALLTECSALLVGCLVTHRASSARLQCALVHVRGRVCLLQGLYVRSIMHA